MTLDPALRWLLEDAQRQGLSLSEYERRYGIILQDEGPRPSAAAQRIRRHEILGGLMTDGEVVVSTHKAKRRARARRRRRLPDSPAA